MSLDDGAFSTNSHRTRAGDFAHAGAAKGNVCSAPFWIHMALIGARYVARQIERAEERDPRCTGLAHDCCMKLVAELEASRNR